MLLFFVRARLLFVGPRYPGIHLLNAGVGLRFRRTSINTIHPGFPSDSRRRPLAVGLGQRALTVHQRSLVPRPIVSRRDGPSSHLDATGDREVVYCHACAAEWYRDEHGLTCPACQGDIIEIVIPGNDPRGFNNHHRSSASTSLNIPLPGFHVDSDPDEAGGEEPLGGDHGLVYSRNIGERLGLGHSHPLMELVVQRFINIVNNFGGFHVPEVPPGRQSHPHFHQDERSDDFDIPLHRPYYHQYGFAQQRIHQTTFRNRPFRVGTESITPVPRHHGDVPPMEGIEDPFQEYRQLTLINRLFPNIFRDLASPGSDRQHPDPRVGHQHAFRSLQDMMGLLSPANAMAGDAVYSQDALDRIISNLMDASPQSNTAPPASEEAIRNLERKPADNEMLAGETKTKCSICIDEIQEGDMGLFLPCKHWFHENLCRLNERSENNGSPGGAARGSFRSA
ncbi:Xylosidase/arabinosidase [Fusarium oxysporum f. sp. albedinis]|nr:Xylosidase/arabinosidase [Fusarium oxysporum f. sp. albedinis]